MATKRGRSRCSVLLGAISVRYLTADRRQVSFASASNAGSTSESSESIRSRSTGIRDNSSNSSQKKSAHAFSGDRALILLLINRICSLVTMLLGRRWLAWSKPTYASRSTNVLFANGSYQSCAHHSQLSSPKHPTLYRLEYLLRSHPRILLTLILPRNLLNIPYAREDLLGVLVEDGAFVFFS